LKKAILFFLFLVSCNSNDSIPLKFFLKKDKFYTLSPLQKNKFLDSILQETRYYKNDSIKTQLLFDVAAQYSNLKNDSKSFKASRRAYQTAVALKDSFSMGRSLYYMGDCFVNYQKDSAYYYYKESEKIFRLLKNEDRLAKVHYNKALLLFYEGNFTESEIEVFKALQNLKNSNKQVILYRCYSLQGSNHLELGEYNRALDYFTQASAVLKIMQNQKIDKDASYDYNIVNTIEICMVYDKMGAYSKSINELKNVIKTSDLEEYPKLHYIVLGNLGYSLMKYEKYEEAEYYLKESLALIKKDKSNQSYLYNTIDYGELKLLTKDSIAAKKLFTEAKHLARKLKSGKELLKALDFLAKVDPKRALKFKSEYIKVNDSIVQRQRENREKFSRIEYETNRVADANEVLSNKNLFLLLGLVVTIALFLIIQVIRSSIAVKKDKAYRKRKEVAENEMLLLTAEFQMELARTKEQEQHRISKELHDGIVNQIYGIRMILGSLNTQTDEQAQKKRLVYIKDLHQLETEIRTLSHELNSNFFKNEDGFHFLIEQLVSKNNEIGQTSFGFNETTPIDWTIFSPVARINFYRILQELFMNVNKYSGAASCIVTATASDCFLIIKVKDDGVGFDLNKTNQGIGLKNIKERCKTIDSTFSIESEIGKGVVVTLKVRKKNFGI
jgi:signal transduction histidine kinase